MAGPPWLGALLILAGVGLIIAQAAGLVSLLSCGGGILLFGGLELLLAGTGIGLLVHPTILVVADVLGVILFVAGLGLTGTGHC